MIFFLNKNATRNPQLSLKISFATHGFPTRTTSKTHTLQKQKSSMKERFLPISSNFFNYSIYFYSFTGALAKVATRKS